MFYNFPRIETINDVLPAIEGRDEFVVADKGDYIVINYNVGFSDTFDIDENDMMANHGRAIAKGEMRRECRGLIFYPSGRLMSRPFHKFFNIGEREETQVRNIDLSKPHVIMEKMDGSMIRPLNINGRLRLGTKMGVTDTSEEAEKIATADQFDWMGIMMQQGVTPLFEFVSPKNRIVVEYDKAELVLLAMRCNKTGEYIPIEDMRSNDFFPVVTVYGSIDDSLEDYIARQRDKEGREGDIIAVGNMRYKIKNDWYVRIHKVKDKIRTDRHILALLLENELDDVYAHLDENDYNRVKQYEIDFHEAYQQTLAFLENAAQMAITGAGGDRKRLATEVLPKSALDNVCWRFVFGYADGKDMNDMLMQHVKSKIGNTVKYNELAAFLGLTEDKRENE